MLVYALILIAYPRANMTDTTDNSKGSKPVNKVVRLPNKLTRSQIKEGFNQFPVEVLLSAGPNKKAQLTHKQKEFARGIAMGKTQAQAYRDSYNTQGKAQTQGDNASRLARDSRIAAEVEAYKLAIEAEKHRTPAQLKSLLVQQLVQHSLDADFPPAQRVQCLKLLGSLFEVGAFVERKEVTTVNRSGDIRARILETLKDVTDVTALDDGLSLLEEIEGATQSNKQENEGITNDAQGVQNPGVLSVDDVDDVILDGDVGSTHALAGSTDADGAPFSDGASTDPTAGAPT
jgi:hypothetical protein